MEPLGSNATVIRYAGYDKPTGMIIHTHARFSVQQDRYVEIPTEELKARFSKNAEIVAKLSNRDPHNLEYIQLDPGSATKRQGPMMVDPVHGKLVAKPRLALSADKLQLAGDGQDTAKIEISVLDESGNAMSGASGAVKITTERGRLADRGGVVNLSQGRAATTLTSVNETVSRVRVSAASLDGSFCSAHVDFEFD
jgi:hypothetical protein